jgi:flagellar basal body-associated protein FliL
MNKKGDLPVTILVIGVLVVCTLALISFFHSSSKVGKAFSGINLIEEANVQIEAGNLNTFYLEKKVSKFSPGFEGEDFSWTKEKIIFSVEYNP